MADAPAAPPAAPASPAPVAPEPTAPAAPVQSQATPPAAPPKGPDASRVLADARRAERAIQAEKRAWKEQRSKEEAQWKERIAAAERYEAAKARSKEAPLTALEELGVSYEELSIAQLNDGKPGADLAIRRAEEKVAALEKKIEDDKKAEAEKAKAKQTDAEKATLARWHEMTTKRVTDAGDKYELVNALGYAPEVGKMVEEHYDATGEEVSWDKAAERLEAHLQAEQEPAVAEVFKRLTATKWFKSRYAPVAKEQPAPAAPPKRSRDLDAPETRKPVPAAVTPPAPPPPTITHRMTASTNPRSAAAASRAELRARAQAILDGKG